MGKLRGGPADGHTLQGLHRDRHFVAMLDTGPWLAPPESPHFMGPGDLARLRQARGRWALYRRASSWQTPNDDAVWEHDPTVTVT